MSNFLEEHLYIDFFGLDEAPYTLNADDRYLFWSKNLSKARRLIASVLKNRAGGAVFIGTVGLGKTLFMLRIKTALKSDLTFVVATIAIAEHAPTPFQLTKEILESFGQECVGRSTKARLDQLKFYLNGIYGEGKIAVLLMDETHRLTHDLTEHIRGLLNFEGRSGKRLQILLFAVPRIYRVLDRNPSLKSRLRKHRLDVMGRVEAGEMMLMRWKVAGGREDNYPLKEDVLDRLYAITKGNPRGIVGIAGAILEELRHKEQQITVELLDEVAETFAITDEQVEKGIND